ncbi:fimbrial protein [Erwinia sp. AnSW2-5]|uniref:fimbrial protein n=1 Tax=Erwinia sp. AnSW2-5 TaxID=3367692 RepID=UPI00385F8A38
MISPLILLISTMLMALSFFSLNAQAGSLKCAAATNEAFPLVAFNGSNGIKLSSSLPIGKTVFHQSYSIDVWCSISDPGQQEAEMAFLIRQTSRHTLGNGLTLFTTFNGNRDSENSVVSTGVIIDNRNAAASLPSRTWQRFSLNVSVEIVKTAKTPERPEQVTPINSRIPLFHVGSETGIKNANFVMLDATTGLTFIAQSCKVQGLASFNVPLGPVRTRRDQGLGSGIGSTNTGKTFSLNFLCDTDVSGDFTVLMQLDGTTPAGSVNTSLIALSDETNSATGVALQIVHADSGTPVNIGQRWQIASYPLADRILTVSFLARYYQTAERITPGKANSTLTWTLNYL